MRSSLANAQHQTCSVCEPNMVVSCDCHSTAPQMLFKAVEIDFLKVLEARSLESRCQPCWFLPEALRKSMSCPLPSFWWLPVLLDVPWLVEHPPDHSLRLHMAFPSVSLSSFLSLRRALSLDLEL